jgi:hypothetical protein
MGVCHALKVRKVALRLPKLLQVTFLAPFSLTQVAFILLIWLKDIWRIIVLDTNSSTFGDKNNKE